MEDNKYKVKNIDYNCDLAQGYGIYKKNETEYELLDYVSSVNISCGFHSADPLTIKKALKECSQKNVQIGAHIGFPDIQGFGYRPMDLDEEEIEAIVIYQIGALQTFAKTYNLEIEHIRLHGAMYNIANKNKDFSLKIAKAIKKADPWLTYIGKIGEMFDSIALEANIKIAHELNVEGVYDNDFNLIENEKLDVEKQIHRLKAYLQYEKIHLSSGEFKEVKVDTIHFKNIESIKIAQSLVKPSCLNYNQVKETGWC